MVSCILCRGSIQDLSFGGEVPSARVPQCQELHRGVQGHAHPQKFFKMNMRWDAIWCNLRHNFEKSQSGILFFSCDHVLTMLHLASIFVCVVTIQLINRMYSMITEPAVRPADRNPPCSLSYSVLRQGILNSCALTSSRLDDFSDIVTYIL